MTMIKLIIFCLLHIVLAYNAVLDIDELGSVYYNIDILKNPVVKKSEWDEEILTVVNKFGQEYVCNIPEIEAVKNDNKKEENLDEIIDIGSLLRPMESAPCLSKRKDWWTYEFCYGSVIKQYHMEDNKVIGPILFLGKYESEYNWKNSTESKNKMEKYHSQYYVNGTRCDITGQPRRTEVRFHCEEGVGDYIKQVDEPQSCKYVVIIATSRLCHHPYLKPQSNKTPYGISCSPALSQDQFEKYQRIEQKKEDKKLASGLNSVEESDKFSEEEEDTKFSIQLLTIPLSSKKNKKKDEGIKFTNMKNEELSTQQVNDILADDEELDSQIDLEDGLDDKELKILMDKIKSDVRKRAPKKSMNSKDSGIIEKPLDPNDVERFSAEEAKDEGRLSDVDSHPDQEGVIEVSSKSLKDPPSFASAEPPKMNKKLLNLFSKWQDTENRFEFDDGDQDESEYISEMLSEFEKIFADKPEFVRDVLQLVEKHLKELTPDGNLETIMKSQTKIKELLSTLSKYLTDADNLFKTGNYKEHMVETYSQLEKIFSDKPEFYNDVLELSRKYSQDFIDEDGPQSLANALNNRAKLEKVFKTLDTAVQTTKDKANKVKEKIRTLENLIDKEVNTMRNWQREQTAESSKVHSEPEDTTFSEEEESSDSESGQLDSLTERKLEPSHKVRLEQKIKERLQKSGLDNIGSKIEVKILSPTLDEEDKDSPVTLSPEETEAIHSMIYNVLEATAEELKERERHQNLMDNYNFSMDESLLEEDGEGVLPVNEEVLNGEESPFSGSDLSADSAESDEYHEEEAEEEEYSEDPFGGS